MKNNEDNSSPPKSETETKKEPNASDASSSPKKSSESIVPDIIHQFEEKSATKSLKPTDQSLGKAASSSSIHPRSQKGQVLKDHPLDKVIGILSIISMSSKKWTHAASSSSQPQSDRHRFRSLAKSILFEEQYKKRTVESEREIDVDLLEKDVCHCLSTRNWYSLFNFEIKEVYTDWVREFYCNLEPVSETSLKTFVRGKWITLSAKEISEFLEILMVENPDYPIPENSQVQIDYDCIGTILCGEDTLWPGGLLPHGNLTEEYRFLNRFVCHNLEPRGHKSDVSHKNGYLLYCIGTGKEVNIPQVILNFFYRMLSAKRNSILPFVAFITEYLLWREVPKKTNELSQRIRNPINARTLALSSAHIPPIVQGAEAQAENIAPGEAVQGEQQGDPDQLTLLREQVQAMHLHMDTRFFAVDGRLDVFDMRFNSIDEALAAILARLGNQ